MQVNSLNVQKATTFTFLFMMIFSISFLAKAASISKWEYQNCQSKLLEVLDGDYNLAEKFCEQLKQNPPCPPVAFTSDIELENELYKDDYFNSQYSWILANDEQKRCSSNVDLFNSLESIAYTHDELGQQKGVGAFLFGAIVGGVVYDVAKVGASKATEAVGDAYKQAQREGAHDRDPNDVDVVPSKPSFKDEFRGML
ncbi:MAG: hypothetical protein ISR65_17090 [Bacteriovoracaceae bacterium]|nr:hypothetical protein [Bacteriovoracaceae bacterium]